MSCYPSVLAVVFRCSRVGFHKMNCLHRPWNRKPSNYHLEKYTTVIWIFHRNTCCRDIGLPLSYRVAGIYIGEHEVTSYFTREKFCRSVTPGTHTGIWSALSICTVWVCGQRQKIWGEIPPTENFVASLSYLCTSAFSVSTASNKQRREELVFTFFFFL